MHSVDFIQRLNAILISSAIHVAIMIRPNLGSIYLVSFFPLVSRKKDMCNSLEEVR
jgi:hypothetical protein